MMSTLHLRCCTLWEEVTASPLSLRQQLHLEVRHQSLYTVRLQATPCLAHWFSVPQSQAWQRLSVFSSSHGSCQIPTNSCVASSRLAMIITIQSSRYLTGSAGNPRPLGRLCSAPCCS